MPNFIEIGVGSRKFSKKLVDLTRNDPYGIFIFHRHGNVICKSIAIENLSNILPMKGNHHYNPKVVVPQHNCNYYIRHNRFKTKHVITK